MDETRQRLILAEQKAKDLFTTVENKSLIVPGKSEKELCDEIVKVAKEDFGIENHWSKKIVRTGINTLQPFIANPPDLIIQEGDIVFFDFHPVFEGWEADLGRTYVLGNDPLKLKLKNDIEAAWHEAKAWYVEQDELTGAAYFKYLTALAKQYGWEYGGDIGGHIVGHFPHEQPDDPTDMGLDIHPGNDSSIFLLDKQGNKRHWILEIHFIDRVNNIGG